MRAFIAIDLPEDVRKEIERIQRRIPEFTGKNTELENLHLTLKFLGEISEEQAEKVRERLKRVKLNKFESEIDKIGVFSEKFVRIVWLHLSNCDELQKKVDESLKDLFPEERRFMSHLTIARVKRIDDKEKFLNKIKKIKIKLIKFSVGNFKLKKSTLTPEGPVYEDLEIYNLE